MINELIISAIVFVGVVILFRVFRKPIISRLKKLKARLNIVSLRMAIEEADKMERATGRKMIVVFIESKGEYQAVEKQTLKTVANVRKVKGQPAQTEFRKKQGVKKPGSITHNRVKVIEKRSLYVTRKTG